MESDLPETALLPTADNNDVPQDGRSKLTYEDIALLVRLHVKGLKQAELADIFKITQGQVSRLLAKFEDTRVLAKARLHKEADNLVETTIAATRIAGARGDATPGLELLDRLDVAPKKRDSGGTGSKVMIVVGGGGQATLPDLPTVEILDA